MNSIACIASSLLLSLTLLPINVGASTAEPPSATPPGYLLVIGRTLDRPKLIAYSMTLPPIYAETGGRYIGTGRPGVGISCLHGPCQGRSAVVAAWDDARKVDAFWWGERYRKVVPLRDRAGVFTVVSAKGAPGITPHAASGSSGGGAGSNPGALLVAQTVGSAAESGTQNWIAAATQSGARSLIPYDASSLTPLEGDALFDRLVLLSFASREARDAFATGDVTKRFVQSTGSPALLTLIAIDAPTPPTQAPPAALTTTSAPRSGAQQ